MDALLRAGRSRGRHRAPASPRRVRTASTAVRTGALAGLAAFALFTGVSMSGWPSALVTNNTNSAATSALSFTHVDGSGSCTGTGPTASVICSPALGTTATPTSTVTDAITNNGRSSVSQSVDGTSCGPVQLANSNNSSDPMLVRNNVSFAPTGGPSAVSGSGAATFNGSSYAAGVASSTMSGSPTPWLGLGTYNYYYGYGLWFKTTASSGILFTLGSNPTITPSSGSNTYDRTLGLSGGKLVFSTSGISTATSSNTVNDGAWHYVYISINAATFYLIIGLSYTTTATMYVDGTSVASTSSSTSLGTPSGYWFLGFGLVGSLSNFAVYDSTNSPTSPPSSPYSAASELWKLNDNGTTTATATLPTALANACAKVNIAFAFTSPTASIAAQSLSAFAGAAPAAVAAPAAGVTQSLTITTSQGSGYTSDITGLQLYVPISFVYGTVPSSNWTLTMNWSGNSGDVFVA